MCYTNVPVPEGLPVQSVLTMGMKMYMIAIHICVFLFYYCWEGHCNRSLTTWTQSPHGLMSVREWLGGSDNGFKRLDLIPLHQDYSWAGQTHPQSDPLITGNSRPRGSRGFSLSLSEWSFTICLTPWSRKWNVLSTSLNKAWDFQFEGQWFHHVARWTDSERENPRRHGLVCILLQWHFSSDIEYTLCFDILRGLNKLIS